MVSSVDTCPSLSSDKIGVSWNLRIIATKQIDKAKKKDVSMKTPELSRTAKRVSLGTFFLRLEFYVSSSP